MSVVSRKILKEYDVEKPFALEVPNNIPHKYVLDFDYKSALISHIKFKRTQEVEIKDYNLIFYSKLEERKFLEMQVLPVYGGWLIVHKKILDLLIKFCHNGFQVLPVYVKSHPDAKKITPFTNTDYVLLNILNCIDSINCDESVLRYFDDGYDANDVASIKKLVFKRNCMNGYHLARDNNYCSLLVASRELALLFNKNHIKGIEFFTDYAAYRP
jgi:hypothetical protein